MRIKKKQFLRLVIVFIIFIYGLYSLYSLKQPITVGRYMMPLKHVTIINNSKQIIDGKDLEIKYENDVNFTPIPITVQPESIGFLELSQQQRVIEMRVADKFDPNRFVRTVRPGRCTSTTSPQSGNLLKFMYEVSSTGEIHIINFVDANIASNKYVVCINHGSAPIYITGVKKKSDPMQCEQLANQILIAPFSSDTLLFNSKDFKGFCYDVTPSWEKDIYSLDYSNENDGGIVGVELSNSIPQFDLIMLFIDFVTIVIPILPVFKSLLLKLVVFLISVL